MSIDALLECYCAQFLCIFFTRRIILAPMWVGLVGFLVFLFMVCSADLFGLRIFSFWLCVAGPKVHVTRKLIFWAGRSN